MFRIRRIYDINNPANRDAVKSAQKILREQFSLLNQKDIEKLPDMLMNPLKYSFRSILFAADNFKGSLSGFAMLLHAPDLDFCYLDFITAARNLTGRGVGSALYSRIRAEASELKSKGLFFECLPDDPALCRDPLVLKQNSSRLKFYERFGARPLINTKYETPLKPDGDNPPYLVIDLLKSGKSISRADCRSIIQAILERKYPDVCNRDYVKMVTESVNDNPVKLRPPKYTSSDRVEPVDSNIPQDKKITLVFNNHHAIHHIHERGYVEAPIRVNSILSSLEASGLFNATPQRHFPEKHIQAVHSRDFLDYLSRLTSTLTEDESVYPYVFPLRNNTRPPRDLPMRAGYYCMDTFTPLNRNAILAARNAVDCALTAAQSIIDGAYLAYALVRPPGHHAERNIFGGFCYFNSTAVAANYLSSMGPVAVLDIDYHHGNGQQSIFYHRKDILTVSIHGHPRFAYPFFTGFQEETGEDEGKGFNLNLPLPEHIQPDEFFEALNRALTRIKNFKPLFLVVALGFDTAKGDPTGTWPLESSDFLKAGLMLGELPYSTLFIQEGGYKTRTIGKNAKAFFKGVWRGSFE